MICLLIFQKLVDNFYVVTNNNRIRMDGVMKQLSALMYCIVMKNYKEVTLLVITIAAYSGPWNWLMWTLENEDTCIIHTLSYRAKLIWKISLDT